MILDRVQKTARARRASSRRTVLRSTTTAVAGAAAVLLALTACTGGGAATSNSTPVSGGTLTYASGDAEPTCLDPHVGGNYPQALLSTQYIEELTALDDGKPVPALAESWTTSDDGKTLTFRLRDDVRFSDGTAFDAAAVVANIEHVQDPATASSTGYLALQSITKATATDDHTVTLTLSRPDSALLESFSQPWVGMESPKALQRPQAENCESPVGTGPFTITAGSTATGSPSRRTTTTGAARSRGSTASPGASCPTRPRGTRRCSPVRWTSSTTRSPTS